MVKHEEIELGARVCRVIKNALYPDKAWIDCYNSIADQYTKLKSMLQGQYVDKSKLEFLEWLGKYDENDIRETLV